jgi:DNA-directed RNA polymerase specialized sigma24 family protein
VLTDAGRAQAVRTVAPPEEAWRSQHRETPEGPFADGPMARLARLREPDGAPSFTALQLTAGERLHADWLASGAARIATSDWLRPSGAPAAGDRGVQARAAARIDASRRLRRVLDQVGPTHARTLEAACLRLAPLAALERALAAPRGTGKARLREALQALAAAMGLTLR